VKISKTHSHVLKIILAGALILFILVISNNVCLSGEISQSGKSVKYSNTSDRISIDLFNAFENDKYSYTAAALENQRGNLNVFEKSLLARIHWAMYYPYNQAMASKACDLMGEAVNTMPDGKDRDALSAEYADMLNKSSKPEEATRLINKLTSSSDNELRFSANVLKAENFNIQKKYNDAYAQTVRIIRNFDLSHISNNLQSRFYAVKGDVYTGLSEYLKALQMYNKALSLDKNIYRFSPDIYLKTGSALFKTGNPADAAVFLEKAVNLGIPSSRTEALIMLGDCLNILGRRDNAYALYYEASINRSPGAVAAMLRMASIIEERDTVSDKSPSARTYEQLTALYRRAISEYPDSLPIVAYSMAKTNARYGKMIEAFKMYYEAWAITRASDSVHVYSKTGAQRLLEELAVQNNGNRDSVILSAYMSYKDSMFKDISNPELLIRLSGLLLKEGYIDDASKMTDIIINTGTSEIKKQAISLLVKIETRKGHLSKALKLTDTCLENPDNFPEIQAMKTKKAELLVMLGRYKEAINYLENLGPDENESLSRLRLKAYLYNMANDTQKEMNVYDSITRLKTAASPVIDRALFIRACDLAGTEPLRAINLFSRLIREYPDSPYQTKAILLQTAIAKDQDYLKTTRIYEEIISSGKDSTAAAAAKLLLNEINIDKSIQRYFKPETESVKNPALSKSSSKKAG
jgi:tetratricopeptide (TPR) repeat protein